MEADSQFVAFAGARRIGSGRLAEAAVAAKRALEQDEVASVLVFDAVSGRVVDLDLRGSEAAVAGRYAPPPAEAARRGRPKLGVIPREVTLLPRHWEWLSAQPGGASVALRKLVEAASKAQTGAEGQRARTDAAYRFMTALAGDLPGFEEAARALFAGDGERLRRHMAGWPPDVADQVFRFLGGAEPAGRT